MVARKLRVLLTGGAGFIGSHLAEALLRRSADLTIVDNLDTFYSPESKRANLQAIGRAGTFEFACVDICSTEALREIIDRARPEIVIHLAARAGVRPSIDDPLLYERVNVRGTLNLLQLCPEYKFSKFIFGSSSSVYGATSQVPFSEAQSELRPISPYGATKLSGELLCHTYAYLYSLPVICLRFFTVYGPRQRPDLAIHKFASLIQAGKPVPIFGNGSSGRDYTYIDDIVTGIIAAAEYQMDSTSGTMFEVFNLGNSKPVKLTELVQTLEQVIGKKALLDRQPFQAGDVPITWADTSKAQRLLNYQPRTSFINGLERFVGWYNTFASQQVRSA